jgi:hypothetical protein
MTPIPSSAKVTVTARPMWRIRLMRELPRYLLQGLAIVGLIASARFALDPPRPVIVRALLQSQALVDRAGEGFASLFARRYLTWDSRDPEAHRQALAPFLGHSMEVEAGFQPPEEGSQHVQWTQVVQASDITPGKRNYTIAVQTDTGGLLYLSVGVIHESEGRLALAGYPALVGPPAVSAAASPERLREVEGQALVTVVRRALRNYLTRAESELAADLAADAHVSLPATTLVLESLETLDWSAGNRSVLAVLRAGDRHGAQYTLAYELQVVTVAGRWEITAIQTNPDV